MCYNQSKNILHKPLTIRVGGLFYYLKFYESLKNASLIF